MSNIHLMFTGKDFVDKYKHTSFYKLTDKQEISNTDVIKLNSSGSYCSGGICFIEYDKIDNTYVIYGRS